MAWPRAQTDEPKPGHCLLLARWRDRWRQTKSPTCRARNYFAQKFEPLACDFGLLEGHPRSVAAWTRKAVDEANADRIDRDCKHDRYIPRGLLESGDRASIRDNDIDFVSHELARDLGDAFGPSLRPTILDRDSATLDPAELLQPLRKGSSPYSPTWSVRTQNPDGWPLARLLCVRSKRPRYGRASN